MKSIRAFIAIELPDEARDVLARVSQEVAAQLPPRTVRWVKPELMHLSLRFLGDTALTLLPEITAGLDRAAAGHISFTLWLDQLGCFPNRKRPRVIWVGVDGAQDLLLALKGSIDESLEPLGWAAETRPFRAHLTLGRVNDGRQLQGVAWGAKVERVSVPVTAVQLIESQLRPDGPLYTIRHTSPLRKR